MCGAKELRIWGPAEGAGLREVMGRSGAELEEALLRVALWCPSHGVPEVNCWGL